MHGMHEDLGRLVPGRVLLFLLLIALPVLPGCLGCNDETVEDDMTTPPPGEEIDLPTEEIPDQPFDDAGQDTPIDDPSTIGRDVDPQPLADQLEPVFFSYDSFELDAEARSVLARNARLMRDREGEVLVEGHCDERGTAQYNMALGWKRANEVKRYLVSLGVPGSRIETVSYGKEKPFVMGQGEEVWAQNRRAHFVAQGR